MSKSEPTPTGAPSGADSKSASVEVAIGAPDFEEAVRQFWVKNRGALIAFSVIVVLGILGREGWRALDAKRGDRTAEAYAAATTDDQLREFAADYAGEPLAGAAHLKIGDTAYREGRYPAAIEAYDQAAALLADTALVGRIKIGRAMATLRSGNVSAGTAALTAIVNDLAEDTAVRAEAAYHLITIASAAGEADRVDELVNQISSIDPTSGWVQRSLGLRTIYGLQTGVLTGHEGHNHGNESGIVFETP